MIFDDWNIEPEQEPFTCPCCGYDRYKPISTITNKSRYKTVTKKSGLTKVSKIRRIAVEVSKDFAECLSCRNRTLLSESEEVIPKETKKEITDKLAKAKFNKHFLNPGSP